MKTANPYRTLLLSVVLAASAAAAPAFARHVNITLQPPAAPAEVMPAIPPGHVWAPGHWAWIGDRYIWVRGRTIVQRAGHQWVADRWVQRDGVFVREHGHWVRVGDSRVVHVKHNKHERHGDDDDRGDRRHGKHAKHERHGDDGDRGRHHAKHERHGDDDDRDRHHGGKHKKHKKDKDD